MKKLSWQIWLGIVLIFLSGLVYLFHYLIFRDAHHIFIYFVGDVGFVFVEVLLVTLIIHHLLEQVAQKARLKKLDMVIGAFFSEVGTRLLRQLSELDSERETLHLQFDSGPHNPDRELELVSAWLSGPKHKLDENRAEWEELRTFLITKRDFLLRLLENPNLLEHESFTDMLWAVFHLTEELEARGSLSGLPAADYTHLGGDMTRVYGQLGRQWLAYMKHLKKQYPYLFSLAIRINPFKADSSPVISS